MVHIISEEPINVYLNFEILKVFYVNIFYS